MNQMCVGIDKPWQDDAPSNVQLLGLPCFGQRFNLRARSDRSNSPIDDEQRSVLDNPQIGKEFSAPRPAPPQRKHLRRASDKKEIRQGVRIMPKNQPIAQAPAGSEPSAPT
jgi:hypothetical protein